MTALWVPLVVIVSLVVIVGGLAWFLWPKIAPWVRDSETLFVARFLDGLGGFLIAAAAVDWTPLFVALGIPKWAGVFALVLGLVTEGARKNRATDL